MAEFLKHSIKNNLKKGLKKTFKVGKVGMGGPATVAYEFLASASPLNDYTMSQEDLREAGYLSYMANAPRMKKPKKMPDSLKRKTKKNKKGAR